VFDYLVVGAGFAGSVVAERLASRGRSVVVIDRRSHVGGNAYDHVDGEGLLVHKYGPHIFHTGSSRVFAYLSQFTDWRPYEHRVLATVDGKTYPFPINIDTVNRLYGMTLADGESLQRFLRSVAVPVAHPRTMEEAVLSRVGRDLYEKFFRSYTRKQWGVDPSELDASLASRVPARMSRDDRYFTDAFQAMPLRGYTRMFERMLSHPRIKVLLKAEFREVQRVIRHREVIFTGPIDEFFEHRFGRLPYRSLEFEFVTKPVETFQPAAVVNHPNEHAFTRVTEFKYLTGQVHPMTSLVYEFPRADGEPYYPVPRAQNAELYRRYRALADATPNVHFVGRLATYKYLNMDQVVGQALALFERLAGTRGLDEGEAGDTAAE
jgi:UDP-galactopyranose mutase